MSAMSRMRYGDGEVGLSVKTCWEHLSRPLANRSIAPNHPTGLRRLPHRTSPDKARSSQSPPAYTPLCSYSRLRRTSIWSCLPSLGASVRRCRDCQAVMQETEVACARSCALESKLRLHNRIERDQVLPPALVALTCSDYKGPVLLHIVT